MYRIIDSNGKVKYSGRSRAKVLDNRDPQKRGRIIVDHPLLGETVWIDYVNTPGQFNPPAIGDIVYIEADAGYPEFPIAHGNIIKGIDSDPDLDASFQRTIPSNRGWKTPGGQKVELDDGVATVVNSPDDTQLTTTNRGIRITSTANNKIHIIEDSAAGNQYILLQDAGGNIIKLDYKNNVLTINSVGKTNINTSSDQTETVGGNLTINVTGNADITASGNVVVQGAQINLNGSGGNVLTTKTDMVVDTIFGQPTVGVPTVTAGS